MLGMDQRRVNGLKRFESLARRVKEWGPGIRDDRRDLSTFSPQKTKPPNQFPRSHSPGHHHQEGLGGLSDNLVFSSTLIRHFCYHILVNVNAALTRRRHGPGPIHIPRRRG